MTTPVPPEMKRLKPFEMAPREAGLGYPEVTEEFPWGYRTLKVKGAVAPKKLVATRTRRA